MKTNVFVCAACAALVLIDIVSSLPVQADTDACALLTAAQISSAVGFRVGTGTHVTPTFVKTCTWTGTTSTVVQFVTLNIQTASFFDGAKKQASMLTGAGVAVKSAGIGDDSYFSVMGTQVALWVKKGNGSFKVAVYKQIPVDQKEAMELVLAKQAAPKL